jgi:hypothetical protein
MRREDYTRIPNTSATSANLVCNQKYIGGTEGRDKRIREGLLEALNNGATDTSAKVDVEAVIKQRMGFWGVDVSAEPIRSAIIECACTLQASCSGANAVELVRELQGALELSHAVGTMADKRFADKIGYTTKENFHDFVKRIRSEALTKAEQWLKKVGE